MEHLLRTEHNLIGLTTLRPHTQGISQTEKKTTNKQKNTKYHIRPNYHTVGLGFSKLLGKLVVKYVSTYTKGALKRDQRRTYLMMLM